MKQNSLVLVYVNKKFEFSDMTKNVKEDYAFEHFVKKLCPNVCNFDEFNMLKFKDKHDLQQYQHLIHH
ncbi:6341_t:CDS:2, partial [Dentiscutata erythropus]